MPPTQSPQKRKPTPTQTLTNWNSVAAPAPASAFLSAPAGERENELTTTPRPHCWEPHGPSRQNLIVSVSRYGRILPCKCLSHAKSPISPFPSQKGLYAGNNSPEEGSCTERELGTLTWNGAASVRIPVGFSPSKARGAFPFQTCE